VLGSFYHECVLSARIVGVLVVHGDALVPRAFSAVTDKFVPFDTIIVKRGA